MRKILEACPTCGGPLTITEVRCEKCATEVRSQYQPCPFCRLSPEQMNFVLLFVRGRGNLTEMEKSLGVSYPTIRGKLDEVINILDSKPMSASRASDETLPHTTTSSPSNASNASRGEILTKIARGEMSVAEGMAALRFIRGESDDA